MTDKLTDNDKQRIEQQSKLIYQEDIRGGFDLTASHQFAFRNGAEYATLYERDKRKLWNDENNNLIKELGRRDGRIQQLEAERAELRNKVIEQQGKIDALTDFLKTIRPYVGQISIPHGSLFLKEIKQLLNSLKTK